MEKQFRYTGPLPYSKRQRALFFGRDLDIRNLTERVVLEKLVVLFGKSGYGKTSLLQAGVIPHLQNEEGHRVISIRFAQPDINPLEQLVTQLQDQLQEGIDFGKQLEIDRELPDDWSSRIWCLAKSLQMASPEKQWITLVIDPFEELFNHAPLRVDLFGKSLAALLNPRPPKAVRDMVKARILASEQRFSDSETNAWFSPLNVKVLLSVRHDHLGSLDRFKHHVPDIFKHTYELQPLNNLQALEALQRPSALVGDFASPPFTFSQVALNKVINTLKDKRTQRIETFQLQLIAQRAEEVIVKKAQANPGLKAYELTEEDLGDPTLIFENFYQETIGSLPRNEKGRARNLVEKNLIVEGNRVPLDQQTITLRHKVPVPILDTLVDKRLLRAELNSVGTTSYELSHDTLIESIEQAARKRRYKRNILILSIIGLAAALALAIMGTILTTAELRAEIKAEKAALEAANKKIDSLNQIIGAGSFRVETVIDTKKADSLAKVIDSLRGQLVEANTELSSQNVGPILPTPPNPPVPEPIDDKIHLNAPIPLYIEWLEKLRALKTNLQGSPDPEFVRVASAGGASDTRPPAQWQFSPADLHLIGVRINVDQGQRVFDARNFKAFYVLLVDGKAFEFLGGTGYFTHDGKLAFLAKGQHGLKLGAPRSDRKLVPMGNGLRLIRDADNNSVLSPEDISKGFISSPVTDVAISWATGSNAITKSGQQLIFNQHYINPSNRIVSLQGSGSDSQRQDAFQVFIGMVWNQSKNQEIRYTLVDLTDFDANTQQEIILDIERLRTGL